MKKSTRIYQIDLFRFIAALWVVLFHYTFRGHSADNLSLLKLPELGAYFKYGYLGVDLFFIISGFVIILSIKNNDLIAFVKSRIVRLYPAYWFCLALTFLVVVIWGGTKFNASFSQLLVNTTMMNGVVGVENVDGVYWSLLVELKFYFMIAVYLVLVKIRNFSLNHVILYWLILSCVFVGIDMAGLEYAFVSRVLNFFFILKYSSYFIAGMLFFKIYKEGQNIWYFVGLVASLAISLYHGWDRIDYMVEKYDTSFSHLIIGLFILSFYVVMYLASTQKLSAINSPKLLKLGVLTYPLYLIHQNIGYITFNAFVGSMNKYVLLTIVLVLVIFVSYLINTFVEVPFSRKLKEIIEKGIENYKKKRISTSK